MVVERGNDTLGSFPHQIFDLSTNFKRKFDNGHCNDVEKQSNFTKFDCLKADLSAFVETSPVSTSYNHYNKCWGVIARSKATKQSLKLLKRDCHSRFHGFAMTEM